MIGKMRFYIGRDNKIHYGRVIKMANSPSGLIYFFELGCSKKIGIPEKYIAVNHEDLKGVKWEDQNGGNDE